MSPNALQSRVIVSFRHKGLKLLYEKSDRSKIRPDLLPKVTRLLTLLDRAREPEDVDVLGFRLHPLRGDLKGYWSAVISRNHRIIFRFSNEEVHNVDLMDYH